MEFKDYILFIGLFIAIALGIVSVTLQLQNQPNRLQFQDISQQSQPLQTAEKRFIAQSVPPSEDVGGLKRRADGLTRMLIKLQSSIESDKRLSGNSGVTHVRSYSSGSQPYYQPSHTTDAVLSIHNHADNRYTIGMGEIGAVLNGVQFLTRHNDYALAQPVNASGPSNYHKTVMIRHPDVPPSVLAQPTIDGQIQEMRKYFEAFQKQQISIRDYRPYFRPVLCVLEGAWIIDSGSITEPFDSDRHFIDAATWDQLNSVNMFLANSGAKNQLENLATLPSAIRELKIDEKYEFYNGSTPTKIIQFSRPVASIRTTSNELISKRAESDGVFIALSVTSVGRYIFIIHDKNDGTAGSVNVSFTCSGVGCSNATGVDCGPTNKPCGTPFVDGTGVVKLAWTGTQVAQVVYGPLEAAWDVTINWIEPVGLTNGIAILKDYADIRRRPGLAALRMTGYTGDTYPVMANFEYRIFCHPLKDYLSTKRFRVVDELASQMYTTPPQTTAQTAMTRRALFSLNSRDSDNFFDGRSTLNLMDRLMEQIPGKDNYDANLTEVLYGGKSLRYENDQVLNTGYYSRYLKMLDSDAMGRNQRKRSFNDDTMWAAMTTQPKVSGLSIEDEVVGIQEQKWTWAIPLEIIYLTPLLTWNPYNITYHGDSSTIPVANGRNGGKTLEKAYDGNRRSTFFRTPAEFFSGAAGDLDAADTSTGSVGVLDSNGTLRICQASGTWIFLPNITGVGIVRTRYPIAPLHYSKTLAYREVMALKHSLQSYQNIMNGQFINLGVPPEDLVSSYSKHTDRALHYHEVFVQSSDVQALQQGLNVTVQSDVADGHSHTFTLRAARIGDNWQYFVVDCDNSGSVTCWDGHDKVCRHIDDCSDSAPSLPASSAPPPPPPPTELPSDHPPMATEQPSNPLPPPSADTPSDAPAPVASDLPPPLPSPPAPPPSDSPAPSDDQPAPVSQSPSDPLPSGPLPSNVIDQNDANGSNSSSSSDEIPFWVWIIVASAVLLIIIGIVVAVVLKKRASNPYANFA